jgi:glycosyltransferase involved in cell wall biosynthesis
MIGFISTMMNSPWGGSEELWCRTAVRLKENGRQVMVSMPDWPDDARPRYFRDLVNSGIPYLRQKEISPSKMDSIMRRLKARAGQDEDVVVWMKKHRPSLMVFAAGANVQRHTWVSACARLRIPYVCISQAAIETLWPGDDQAKDMHEDYENALRCYFVCQANLDTTRFQTGCSGDNFEVVSNPFSVPYNVKLDWPDETNGFRIAFVGRLEPGAKGCDLLLRAFASPAWRNRPVSLHFYGDGASANGMRQMAALLKLDNAIFHGRVNNLEQIWRENHMLALTSRYEGLPLAVVEAMLCGRPCLVTDVSGNAELLEDGISGFIAPGPSVASVSHALESAWDNRTRWKTMGQEAAVAVRKAVPEDPIGVFAEKLMAIAG